MVSTMEIASLVKLHTLEPDLRLGWTVPKTGATGPATAGPHPAMVAGLAAMRRRLPKTIADAAPRARRRRASGPITALITPKLVAAAEDAGVELIAWTVDDAERIAELAEMGVDGIVSNDPRLFERPRRLADIGRRRAEGRGSAEEMPGASKPEDAQEPKELAEQASRAEPDAASRPAGRRLRPCRAARSSATRRSPSTVEGGSP